MPRAASVFTRPAAIAGALQRVGAAAILGALLAASPIARGSEIPHVAVVGIHDPSMDEARQLAAVDRLIAAIEQQGTFDALKIDEVAAAIGDRGEVILEEGLLSEGRAALQNGKNAYNQASPEDAVLMLESALHSFHDVFPGAFAVEDVWEAWIYLGTSHLQQDPPNEAAANAAFAAALALLPKRPLNPAMYPPHIIEMFEGVREILATHGTSLEISSASQAQLTVWLDGVERGVTPLTIPDVAPGEHFLVGRGERSEAALPLQVPANPEGPVQVALDPGGPTLGHAPSSPIGRSNQISSLYGALGKRAEGIDYVLVAGVVEGSLSLQLLRVGTNTFSKPVELPLSGDLVDLAVQTMPLLLGSVAADGSFVATAPAPAALSVADNHLLALLLDGYIEPTRPDVVVPPPPKRSKVGLVLGIVGGVLAAGAAGTGGYLLLAEPPPVDGPKQGTIVVQF